MNLAELTDGTPATKPWLNIVAATVTAGTVQADVVTANSFNAPVTTAYVSMVNFNTLAAPQAAANLLVGLSPNSRLTIPANSLFVGDVYRLLFNAVINAPLIGDSCTFDLGTVAAGPITTFPVVAATGSLIGVPLIGRCDIVVASPTTINTNTTIAGFVNAAPPPVLAGFSFAVAGTPFDTSVAQTFTFTYTTANVASIEITEILLQRIATGSV